MKMKTRSLNTTTDRQTNKWTDVQTDFTGNRLIIEAAAGRPFFAAIVRPGLCLLIDFCCANCRVYAMRAALLLS